MAYFKKSLLDTERPSSDELCEGLDSHEDLKCSVEQTSYREHMLQEETDEKDHAERGKAELRRANGAKELEDENEKVGDCLHGDISMMRSKNMQCRQYPHLEQFQTLLDMCDNPYMCDPHQQKQIIGEQLYRQNLYFATWAKLEKSLVLWIAIATVG